MDTNNYLQDLKDIKDLMNKSTQFISLSGLSGVLAGVYALIGAFVAQYLIRTNTDAYVSVNSSLFQQLVLVALAVLVFSLITAYIFTVNKAKKTGEKVWNSSSKRLLINFFIPLVTGGILTLLLFEKSYYDLIVPTTLIFYGMACLNASKYTLRDVRYLGITEIILGLLSVVFSNYGLYFWALGFGICHILYGTVMHYKYDRK
ncbi:hypothetical protein [Flavobacterium sp.]|uniref:hypothetical protein n=1 Tax=Flavobacterium sp. TaxID=239 RepID=UPI0026064AA3|nr:hypothetical protein [Flavobacterium sp.]